MPLPLKTESPNLCSKLTSNYDCGVISSVSSGYSLSWVSPVSITLVPFSCGVSVIIYFGGGSYLTLSGLVSSISSSISISSNGLVSRLVSIVSAFGDVYTSWVTIVANGDVATLTISTILDAG